MRKQDIGVVFACYRVLPRLRTTGIPSKYFSRIDSLIHFIGKNKQYKIDLMCKAKHLQKLYNKIPGRYIHKIYTLGRCTDHKITNKEITMINTNAQDLLFH